MAKFLEFLKYFGRADAARKGVRIEPEKPWPEPTPPQCDPPADWTAKYELAIASFDRLKVALKEFQAEPSPRNELKLRRAIKRFDADEADYQRTILSPVKWITTP